MIEASGGSSSDGVLRHHAPPFLTERWRLALHPDSSAAERLGARIAFAESATAFLTGVMAAELHGLRRPPPPALLELERRLDRPTFGLWVEAAAALSRELLRLPDLLAPALPRILLDPSGTGAVETDASKALRAIVALRNREVAHGGDGPVPSEETARAVLLHLEEPLRVFSTALRCLREIPVFAALECTERFGGQFQARVGVFRGAEVEERDLALAKQIRTRAPFLVGRDGTLLYLDPWIVFDLFDGTRRELRLLRRWEDAPRYESPSARMATPHLYRDLPPSLGPEGFLSGCTPSPRVAGVLEPQHASLLLGRPAGAPPPIQLPGGYVLERRLGVGSTGSVWLAGTTSTSGRWGPRIAVKILRRELLGDRVALERFRREHELASRVEHPAVARVHDVLEDDEAGPCILMEYIEGEGLDRCKDSLDPPRAARLAHSILSLLEETHALGIVHRDIKPSNLLIQADGRVRLLDFGIAALVGAERLTRTLDGVGTVGFAAPEQFRKQAIDPRTDLYGVGRLILWMLSGGRVDDGALTLPSLPGELQVFLHRALRPDPAERYASAKAMREELERILRGEAPPAALRAGDHLGDGKLHVEKVLGLLEPGLQAAVVRHAQGERRSGLLFAMPCAHVALERMVEQGLGGSPVSGPFQEPGSPGRLGLLQVEGWQKALDARFKPAAATPTVSNANVGAAVAVGAAALGFAALAGLASAAGVAALKKKQAAMQKPGVKKP